MNTSPTAGTEKSAATTAGTKTGAAADADANANANRTAVSNTPATYQAIRQARRPEGRVTPDDFRFVSGPIPELAPGEILVHNLALSVDPYMREAMHWREWEKGFGLEGRALGRVLASRDAEIAEGTIVFHRHSWATHAVVTKADLRVLPTTEGVPLTAYLGILGGTGLTAYVGLKRIAKLQPGEDLFISAAAGGVGTAAARIARVMGARRLIGSTGSAAKAKHLVEHVGFDAAIDYRAATPLADQLGAAAPDGIDVYFDNVGGTHLEAAISVLRHHGRIAWCGAVAQYNDLDNPPAAPANLYDIVGNALRLEGFLVRDHLDAREEFEDFLIPHIVSGAVPVDETVVHGFAHTVDAFLSMLDGGNTGKMVVTLEDD
ncbi:NADP-dependent oxidoreductase [Catenulispora sp. NF23]|uniref:NADP-dependent oxidoreductase n=1 Tax=Catenulispora pinistramenti TaxID=2705254 RepID=UPI001BA5CAB7|nr:NADP-dependent oxidoreductase [Catenulispora pinistramenti]MBS2533038.1 NADP-dependent oxidoreductase [Catenulispora pinistramenti]